MVEDEIRIISGGRGCRVFSGFGGGGGFRGGDNRAGAVVVTLEEMEVGIKLFSVGEGEGLLTFGTNQLNKCCSNCDEHDKVIITFLQ